MYNKQRAINKKESRLKLNYQVKKKKETGQGDSRQIYRGQDPSRKLSWSHK